jgi:hypothetical protein
MRWHKMKNEIITVALSRKPRTIEEIGHYLETRRCFISDVKELNTMEYENFTSNFLNDYDFLEGTGGRPPSGIRAELQVIEIVCVGVPTLYVNAEGFSYARYVGYEAK